MSANEVVIKVPDIGEGIAEVELVAWRVQPGDLVAEDQLLADVMTDKATVEVPSPLAGRVLALGGEVGQTLAVGAALIRLEREGGVEPAAARAEPVAPAAASPAPAAPSARPPAAQPEHRPAAPPAASGRTIASPAVRARAWELGIDIAHLAGSGPAGRVTHADLDAQAARGGAPHSPAAAPSTATHTVKIVGLRRRIAQKMQDSKRRAAHFSYVEEVDVSELEALRARLNARWGDARGRLTLLPLLARAIVLAVRDEPQVNAHFDDEAGVLTRFDAVHLGIATQTDAGLLVPVLRDAQACDLWSAAAGIARLADAARAGRAVRAELSGSTITLSSLGKLGGIAATPVLNLPEVAIVGVNRIVLRPVIRDGAVVARQMMNLSSSFDHRVVDGAVAAAFVQALRERLEHPALLFVE